MLPDDFPIKDFSYDENIINNNIDYIVIFFGIRAIFLCLYELGDIVSSINIKNDSDVSNKTYNYITFLLMSVFCIVFPILLYFKLPVLFGISRLSSLFIVFLIYYVFNRFFSLLDNGAGAKRLSFIFKFLFNLFKIK